MKDFNVYQASGYLMKLVTDASDVREIYDEISGSLVEFDTPISAPLAELIVDINPVQDLHGQDAPYPAGGGKNLFNASIYATKTANGVTCTNNGDGSFTLNGTATADVYFDIFSAQFKESAGGTPLPTGSYRITGCPSDGSIQTYYMYITPSYTPDTGSGGTNTNTTVTGGAIFVKSGYTCNDLVFWPMIRVSTNGDDTFAPHSNICPITGWTGCEVWVKNEYDTSLPATASVTFPDSTGTVYGGTVDLVSGELVVDRAKIVLDGTQEIFVSNWRATSTSVGWIYRYNLTNNKIYSEAQDVPNLLCNTLETVSYGSCYYGTVDNAVTTQYGTTPMGGICIRIDDTSLTNNTAINNYLSANPIEVVYELAEPIEIQLTPQEIITLVGVNNIWADTGDVSVKYRTH